jgi:hypothetical protein
MKLSQDLRAGLSKLRPSGWLVPKWNTAFEKEIIAVDRKLLLFMHISESQFCRAEGDIN